MIQPGIAKPVDHGCRERQPRVPRKVRGGCDLLEQDVPQKGAQPRVFGCLTHRPHAREQRERRGRGVRTVQEPQLALSVEADVGSDDHRLGEDVDRERRPQGGGIGLDRPEGVRLCDGEERVGVAMTLLECRAHIPGRRARRDPVHERGAEPHAPPQPLAELRPLRESPGQAVDHGGEARPVVVYQLGGDDEQRRAVGQAHEARLQQVRQPVGEARVRAKARLRHVAHDHLQLRPRNHVAHGGPLGVCDQGARDRAD